MLNQIIVLLITALKISVSHQCDLPHQDNDSHLNPPHLPCPFPCRRNVPGVSIIFGHHTIPMGPVNNANPGPVGSNEDNLEAHRLFPGNTGHVSISPIPEGLAPLSLRPNVLNGNSAELAESSVPVNVFPLRLGELVASGAGLQIAGLAPQCPRPCVRHTLVPVPVQVVEECIANIPVMRKTVKHVTETFTRHVPVHEKTVAHQYERIIRHVPVARTSIRNVIETRVRHVPVIKSLSRRVVEPYMLYVPITECFTRPVEDSITRNVPYTVTKIRPTVTHRTRLVPVVETRCKPIVETCIRMVPIRRKYVRNVVEQRVRPVVGPCHPCFPCSEKPECTAEQELQPQFNSQMSNNHEYHQETQSPTLQEGPSDSYDPQTDHSMEPNSNNESVSSSGHSHVHESHEPTSNPGIDCPCVNPFL